MTNTTSTDTQPRRTALGSPCSRAWDNDWIAIVNAAEQELERRICGARTLAGTPCTLQPNHKNGRCRFHGGFDLTGAPKGNRNAVLHGLYSRRLQVCGAHCPQWTTCPLSGEDVEHLGRPRQRGRVNKTMVSYQAASGNSHDVATPKRHRPAREGEPPSEPQSMPTPAPGPAREGEAPSEPAHAPSSGSDGASPSRETDARPEALRNLGKTPVLMTCPYEQAEYNAVFNDALASAERKHTPDPLDLHHAHTVALLHVMMSRAAAALRAYPFVDVIRATGKHYRMESSRVSPYFDAFIRIAREYRALLRLLEPARQAARNPAERPSVDALVRNAARTQHDTELDPEAQQAMHLPSDPLGDHARRCVQRAARHAALSQDLAMILELTEAYAASPELAACHERGVLRAYRPRRQVIQPEAVSDLVARLRPAFAASCGAALQEERKPP